MTKQNESTVQAVLINYFDVWGNKKDGYEVNNLCNEGIVILPDKYNNKDILKALKDAKMLKKHVRLNMLEIENLGDRIEISSKRDYKPLFGLDFYSAAEENIDFYKWEVLND